MKKLDESKSEQNKRKKRTCTLATKSITTCTRSSIRYDLRVDD
jgi:hypothetical protein